MVGEGRKRERWERKGKSGRKREDVREERGREREMDLEGEREGGKKKDIER